MCVSSALWMKFMLRKTIRMSSKRWSIRWRISWDSEWSSYSPIRPNGRDDNSSSSNRISNRCTSSLSRYNSKSLPRSNLKLKLVSVWSRVRSRWRSNLGSIWKGLMRRILRKYRLNEDPVKKSLNILGRHGIDMSLRVSSKNLMRVCWLEISKRGLKNPRWNCKLVLQKQRTGKHQLRLRHSSKSTKIKPRNQSIWTW